MEYLRHFQFASFKLCNLMKWIATKRHTVITLMLSCRKCNGIYLISAIKTKSKEQRKINREEKCKRKELNKKQGVLLVQQTTLWCWETLKCTSNNLESKRKKKCTPNGREITIDEARIFSFTEIFFVSIEIFAYANFSEIQIQREKKKAHKYIYKCRVVCSLYSRYFNCICMMIFVVACFK